MSSAEVLASVDIVALRLNPGHGLELLLIRRAQAPFAGQWALPGVLVNGRSADHSLDDAAVRALRDKARLEPAYIEQVATVGNAVRDPRGWSLSVFYLVLVGPDTRVEDDDLDFVPLRDVRSERFALPFDHAQLVQQSREQAQVSVQRAHEAGKALGLIAQAVEGIAQSNAQISTATEEQTATASEVSQNIDSLNASIGEVAEGAVKTSTSSVELAKLANGLEQQIQRFTV